MKWADRDLYAEDADLTLYWPDVRPCWEAMVKGPEEFTITEEARDMALRMGYPTQDDPDEIRQQMDEAGPFEESSDREALKEQEAELADRLKELEEQRNALMAMPIEMPARPRCRADISIQPVNADGLLGHPLLDLSATGSMVFVGEIVRSAGRIFAEEMYMHDVDVPDSANEGTNG